MKKAFFNINIDPVKVSRYDEFISNFKAHDFDLDIYEEYHKIEDEDELIARLQGCDAYLGTANVFTKRVIDSCPQLKLIARSGVGYDSIDVDAATKAGVCVAITPGAGAEAVSEFAFTLMCSAARGVVKADKEVRRGEWDRTAGPALWHKTLGIVGMGRIGKKLAQISSGFDMKVVAFDKFHDEEFAKKFNVTYYDNLDEMLKVCDFVSVHANLSPETVDMISDKQFDLMKPTAVIVNAARGGIINEDALYRALKAKKIYAAGIDVFTSEPPKKDCNLFELDNIIVSAHNAGSSLEGKNALYEATFQNAIDFFEGNKFAGIVNPDYVKYIKK